MVEHGFGCIILCFLEGVVAYCFKLGECVVNIIKIPHRNTD